MPRELYTIGHSTHPIEEFLGLLGEHRIEAIADIRRFPGSRKHPQFNQAEFQAALATAGVEYHWLELLGGRRGKASEASDRNAGLRNDSFRNYADYMDTPEFHAGIAELLALAEHSRTATMCSEGLFWRCHRRLVSDYLLAQGHQVWNIMPGGKLEPHKLTAGSVIRAGTVTYPAADADQGRLFE
jgi:uncharacterized protein (DUF488 family)